MSTPVHTLKFTGSCLWTTGLRSLGRNMSSYYIKCNLVCVFYMYNRDCAWHCGTKRSLYSLDPKGYLMDCVFSVIFVALLIASNGIRPWFYFMGSSPCRHSWERWIVVEWPTSGPSWLIRGWKLSTDVILKTVLIESSILNIPITVVFVLLSDNSNFMVWITV
jgi:hypothetical protein